MLLDTRQQDAVVILRELILLDGFDPVSPSLTVRDVTTELSGPRLTSCYMEYDGTQIIVVVVVTVLQSLLSEA
ncbi:unnamed protein product [Schistosoma margrebowiei]|uniref:Uncharacterized protein n=1 Tax=Schistosoma margrebowiei TaxID=48269 RepID=A0A183N241_9TREM|nr:unnamed protein product [Schistosoma margrebowiei]